MHISAVYSPLELTYSIEILLTNAKSTAQLLTFRSLVETGKPSRLIRRLSAQMRDRPSRRS
jgi:hypothetical protein